MYCEIWAMGLLGCFRIPRQVNIPIAKLIELNIHYRQKMEYLESTQEHSYFTIGCAGNGYALITNKFCDFNATLTSGSIEEKREFAMSGIKGTP